MNPFRAALLIGALILQASPARGAAQEPSPVAAGQPDDARQEDQQTVPAAAAAVPAAAAAPESLLALLPGRWRGEQQAGGAALLETVVWQEVLGGQFLECRSRMLDPVTGNTTYEGIGLLRHDAGAGDSTFHWFDSNGRIEVYRGGFEGETLVLAAESPGAIGTLTFRRDGDGYSCHATRAAAGGGEMPVFHTSYRRVEVKKSSKKERTDKDEKDPPRDDEAEDQHDAGPPPAAADGDGAAPAGPGDPDGKDAGGDG